MDTEGLHKRHTWPWESGNFPRSFKTSWCSKPKERRGGQREVGFYKKKKDLDIWPVPFFLPFFFTLIMIMCTASSEFGTYRLCRQRRFRRACASAQSRQNLRCSLIQAVSQEEPSDRKPDPWPLWMAGHAQSKFVMTECSKTQIRLTGLMSNLKEWRQRSFLQIKHKQDKRRSLRECVCNIRKRYLDIGYSSILKSEFLLLLAHLFR